MFLKRFKVAALHLARWSAAVSSFGAAALCAGQAESFAQATEPSAPPFQPLIQRTVSDDSMKGGGAFLIDLDTGRVHSPPADVLNRGLSDTVDWMSEQGIDAMCEGASEGFIGFDMIAMNAGATISTTFPDFPKEDALRRFQLLGQIGKAGTPVSLNARAGVGPVATYLFKTREGTKGVLQIAGWDEQTQAVRLNYRLAGAPALAALDEGEAEMENAIEGEFDAVAELAIRPQSEPHLLDLDANELRPIPNDEEIRDWDQFIRQNEIHIQVKPFATREVRFYNTVIVGAERDWWDDPRKAAVELRWLHPVAPVKTVLFRASADLPATFLFETEARAQGILQIVTWDEASQAVRLRYRKISSEEDIGE